MTSENPDQDYGTVNGRPVTDADIEAWADEAERGYDVETLKRRSGRPPLGNGPSRSVTVRLDQETYDALVAIAKATSSTVSELLRAAAVSATAAT